MSLNWSLAGVENRDEVCFESASWYGQKGRQIKAMTEHLIWATMFVGMPEITEVNHQEFYRRIHLWEEKNGAQVHEHNEGETTDIFVSLDDVKAHIGLYTNASRMSPKQFLERLNSE